MRYICCLLLILAFSVHAADASPKRHFPDNPRLAVLFQEDQDDRHGFPNSASAGPFGLLPSPGTASQARGPDSPYGLRPLALPCANAPHRPAWIAATLDPKPKYLHFATGCRNGRQSGSRGRVAPLTRRGEPGQEPERLDRLRRLLTRNACVSRSSQAPD